MAQLESPSQGRVLRAVSDVKGIPLVPLETPFESLASVSAAELYSNSYVKFNIIHILQPWNVLFCVSRTSHLIWESMEKEQPRQGCQHCILPVLCPLLTMQAL